MVDWNDPMVIVGSAQVFMAFVLVIFTAFLWRSTDKYATLTEKDLKEKETFMPDWAPMSMKIRL
jgi:hypothetical protein